MLERSLSRLNQCFGLCQPVSKNLWRVTRLLSRIKNWNLSVFLSISTFGNEAECGRLTFPNDELGFFSNQTLWRKFILVICLRESTLAWVTFFHHLYFNTNPYKTLIFRSALVIQYNSIDTIGTILILHVLYVIFTSSASKADLVAQFWYWLEKTNLEEKSVLPFHLLVRPRNSQHGRTIRTI